MSTLIVGCGYLGRRAGRRLVRSGGVFGTTRSPNRAAELGALGIAPVVVDVLDPDGLKRLPEADRVLYCVGFDRAAGVPMRTVYVQGVVNTIRSLAGRTTRLVYASATSVYAQADGEWVNEDSPALPTSESGRVCLEAEQTAAELCARHGIELVIVRYSGLYGPGRLIRRAAVERGEPLAGDPSKFLNLIHIDDAAMASICALEARRVGPLYLASDDQPSPRSAYYEALAALLGAPAPRFVVPEPGAPAALRDESNKRISNERIKRELGLRLEYPNLQAGLTASLREES